MTVAINYRYRLLRTVCSSNTIAL